MLPGDGWLLFRDALRPAFCRAEQAALTQLISSAVAHSGSSAAVRSDICDRGVSPKKYYDRES